MKRYMVMFEFEVEDFGFEGEEVYYMSCAKRFFNGYDAKENFIQELDMSGDEKTRVLSELSIPMWKHNLCRAIAKTVMLLGGYRFRHTTNFFYWLLHKGLVDIMHEPMCEEFDHKGYPYR